ncbi:MAG: DUF790 family protein [bacterium]
MIPWSILSHSESGSEVVLHYLRETDHAWLRSLLDVYLRFAGRKQRELDEHLQAPLPVACSPLRLSQARCVLDKLCRSPGTPPVRPRAIRSAVFETAAADLPRQEVLRRVARRYKMTVPGVEEALFADLPAELRLAAPPPELTPGVLALHVNLAMVQSLLHRAHRVLLDLEGHARTVLGQARWLGLMCVVGPGDEGYRFRAELSGPMALFRRTRVYGRALAGLVPQLAWCNRFHLRAECELAGEPRWFRLQSGDPVLPAAAPARFDSRVEARFHEDFLRLAPDWDLIREPQPVQAGPHWLFPDFAIQHRRHVWRRWLLEIVGFWTPEYLRHKCDRLLRLRTAGQPRLLLAIDHDRQCGTGELPPELPIVWYRKRVDPAEVLRIIEAPP